MQKIIKTAAQDERERLVQTAENEGQGLLTSFAEAVELIEGWCNKFNDHYAS